MVSMFFKKPRRVRITEVHRNDGMYGTGDMSVVGAVGTFDCRNSVGMPGWLAGEFKVESYPDGCYYKGTEKQVPTIVFNYVHIQEV